MIELLISEFVDCVLNIFEFLEKNRQIEFYFIDEFTKVCLF